MLMQRVASYQLGDEYLLSIRWSSFAVSAWLGMIGHGEQTIQSYRPNGTWVCRRAQGRSVPSHALHGPSKSAATFTSWQPLTVCP